MKEIIAIEKKKKGYQVSFDHETFLVFPEVYIKHHLRPGLSLTEEAYQRLIEDHFWVTYLNMALLKLKKMMTVKEMTQFLEEKGASKQLIKQLIHYMIEKKYLNDLFYVKTYMELKKYQEGPNMMAYKLKEKGVSDTLLESMIKDIHETDVLYDLISKAISNETKKSKHQTIRKIKDAYLKKGFSLESIDYVISRTVHLYQGDEVKLLEKEYEKLKIKLKKNHEGYALKKRLMEKLYQKGYPYEAIQSIIGEDEEIK